IALLFEAFLDEPGEFFLILYDKESHGVAPTLFTPRSLSSLPAVSRKESLARLPVVGIGSREDAASSIWR
ncbi:MAG: hypothetical protein AAGU11_18140, partial [Syntrophobacteraceae bacterium]